MLVKAVSLTATAFLMSTILLHGCHKEQRETESRSESGNIIVTEPDRGARIRSPLTVAGKARVWEAALTVRVLTEDRRELARKNIMASQGAPEFGDFSTEVEYDKPPRVRRGIVQALSYSLKDGSPINIVDVPVEFRD